MTETPSSTRRPTVLVLLGCFWPGNDASGPNQSFRALAQALGDRFEFRLVARDRPTGADHSSMPGDEWTDLGFARARYCRIGHFGAVGLRAILSETPHDLLWLNSVFDREFTLPALAVRRLGAVPEKPTLLSPRGEFGFGALGVKSAKKRIFLAAARQLRLWRDVTLHATSEAEAHDMAAGVAKSAPIVVAPNIRLPLEGGAFEPAPDGALRLAFVGRLAPVKQLDYALRVLACIRFPVVFEIFGPAEDAGYWRRCQELIAGLPENIRAIWRGEASNEAVAAALTKTDLFFLPTAGENFGHAIFEALSSGTPVLISDQTPWRGLAASGAGWDLPLADMDLWVAAIDRFAGLPDGERAAQRLAAANFARQWFRDSGAVEKNVAMLTSCIGAAP